MSEKLEYTLFHGEFQTNVEAFDSEDECYMVKFSGPEHAKRAAIYADWLNKS